MISIACSRLWRLEGNIVAKINTISETVNRGWVFLRTNRCCSRNTIAIIINAIWWCQEFQFLAWYWSKPRWLLPSWKLRSIKCRWPCIYSRRRRLVCAGALLRLYFTLPSTSRLTRRWQQFAWGEWPSHCRRRRRGRTYATYWMKI